MDSDSTIRELEQRLKASVGLRIHYKCLALKRSYGIFGANYLVLCRTLDRIETLGYMIPMLSTDNEEQLQKHSFDVAFVLHNFLAGAATLKDHTKVFRREEYSKSTLGTEYDDEIGKRFDNDPFVQFVLRLRNYTLHERLPITGSWIHFKNTNDPTERLNAYVSLNVRKLHEHRTRNHNKWNVKSREYLDSLDDKIKVRDVAERYKAVIEDFYRWFDRRQQEVHKQDFANARRLQAELKATRAFKKPSPP